MNTYVLTITQKGTNNSISMDVTDEQLFSLQKPLSKIVQDTLQKSMMLSDGTGNDLPSHNNATKHSDAIYPSNHSSEVMATEKQIRCLEGRGNRNNETRKLLEAVKEKYGKDPAEYSYKQIDAGIKYVSGERPNLPEI